MSLNDDENKIRLNAHTRDGHRFRWFFCPSLCLHRFKQTGKTLKTNEIYLKKNKYVQFYQEQHCYHLCMRILLHDMKNALKIGIYLCSFFTMCAVQI